MNIRKSEFHGATGFSKRAVIAAISVLIILGGMIGGTIAWLSDTTEPVKNTFKYGDIDITLTETDTQKDNDTDPNTNTYIMVPGNKITKDPLVTVLNGSEASWLFVKLEKSANFDSFMEYTVANGWTALPGSTDVYYREVDKVTADTTYQVIADDTVTVKDTVTKAMLNALDANGASDYPTLTVTAYAVQRDAAIDAIDTAEEAWAIVGK